MIISFLDYLVFLTGLLIAFVAICMLARHICSIRRSLVIDAQFMVSLLNVFPSRDETIPAFCTDLDIEDVSFSDFDFAGILANLSIN